jgi:ABC-type bacteriocin/lantibiotic exporter with double-glycine peptidase domain
MFMTFANFLTVLAYFFLLSRYEGSLNLVNTLFFILLLTLNVILYDRYRQVYRERHRA